MNIADTIKVVLNNIIQEGLTDIFPRPFEVDLLKNKNFYNDVVQEVKMSIESALDEKTFGLQTLKVHPIYHVLYPKKEAFDFRKCALIDPMDTIKYFTLVMLLAKDIEKARINKSKNYIFSYRYKIEKDNPYIFDKNYNYTSFTKQTNDNIKKRDVKVIVKCDISNFYDRLNLHRLESSLLSITEKKNVVKLINELLLFWANRDSYGLPVGSNPSRILAESLLIDVDKFLLSHNVKFCRFVDDYRLFAPDAKTAHYWLTLLIERLSIEGLFINQSKTIVEDVTLRKEDKITNQEKKNVDEFKDDKISEKRIISGYSGTIPTKFRSSSESEISKIQSNNYDELIKHVETSKIILPDEFREYCKILVYKEMYEKFKLLPELLNSFPQFTPYVTDLLIKFQEKIPDDIITFLKDEFSKWLNVKEVYIPEYIAISLVKLLSTKPYINLEVVFDYFRQLKRNAGSYIGRATLESLEPIIERGQVLEIRQYYSRADLWEKRQIVKIIDRHLHKEEKNAWFKNITMNDFTDKFLIETFKTKK